MTDRITLIVADDHAVVRRGLAAFIETADDLVLTASVGSGKEAIEAASAHAPDIVLLDLLMPDHDPASTVRQIKSVSPRTQIVILTSHEGTEALRPVMAAGAISYVLKDTAPEELLDIVRLAQRGEGSITPRLARSLLEADQDEVLRRSGLTEREFEVLQAIATGRSNRQIAEDLGIVERTVKSHVSNILSKLYLNDRTQAAIYAWREGLMEKE